jgi:mannitol-1-/sugar-/sorbitol-6-phosphatase
MTQILCSALLIDMDGVLVDSTPAVARVWTRWAARFHMDPSHVIASSQGRTSLASLQQFLPDSSPETHLQENAWMERAEIEDVADLAALPGAREVLAAVPASQRAVVTSATRALAEVRLRAAGLWDLVRYLISSDDVTRSKPDPEPYQKGAALIGIPPKDCVVIEDAAFGTRAGKATGARVLALRTTTGDAALLAAGANWIVNDCASLKILTTSASSQLSIELLGNSGHPPTN